MKASYITALNEVLKWEGGYSNHPADPGGATMKGVTQRVYDGYRQRHGEKPQHVKLISDAELQAIYKLQYWDAICGDDLPAGVDFCAFDVAVNSGPVRAIKFLQAALGEIADGHIGQVTLHAASVADHKATVNAICNARLSFLKKLSTWKVFGGGWLSRVSGVRAKAIQMLNSTPK